MFVVVTGSMITVAKGTDVSKASVGRVTFIGCGVGVGTGVAPVMVMRPSGSRGAHVFRLSSMKIKLSGVGFQARVLKSPGLLLTLNIFRLHSNPDPDIGVKSSEKADRRRIRPAGPVPGRMLAETFQLLAVIPPDDTMLPAPGPV